MTTYTYEVDHGDEDPRVYCGMKVNGGTAVAVQFGAGLTETENKAERMDQLGVTNASLLKELSDKNKRIAELEQVARKAETLYNNIGTHSSSRKWVDQKHVDDLGFALCDINE